VRSVVAVILTTGLLAGACGGGVRGSNPPPSVPSDGFDLGDETLREQLGSGPPADIDWRRTLTRADGAAVAVVGRGTSPDQAELSLIQSAVRDIPGRLWAHVDLRTIVRTTQAPGERAPHEQPVAYALGPDVYLLDQALTLSDDGSSRYELARALIHELVHVAQFATLADDYVAAALRGDLATVDPTVGSVLVGDFAAATGWNRVAPDERSAEGPGAGWQLPPDVAASTEYGRSNPGEDMAEAVTLVLIGRDDAASPDRIAWVEEWLGDSTDRLAAGRPWVPGGATEVLSIDPLYDESAVADLAGADRRTEPAYFELPEELGATDEIAAAVTERLLARGFAGAMTPIEDRRVPRVGGRFIGQNGIVWWVELWDFRFRAEGTSGPTSPVLAYVAVW
jgi:hypothetical protein